MRIISQDETIDVPYEHTTLIREGTEIYLSSIKLRDTLIAKYSTEEKAVKAMEMCRKKYADSEFNRSVLCGMGTQIGMMPDNIVEVLKDGICDNFTFRFPEDEEVD